MTMTRLLSTLLLAAAIAALSPAVGACPSGTQGQAAQTAFIVSVVLLKDGDGVTIKLAHALQPAPSAEAATQRVVRAAQQQYPGYTVVNTLATPSSDKARTCAPSTERQAFRPAGAREV